MRWMLVFLIALLIFNRAGAWLQKIGLGRLPGDIRLRLFGRELFLPLASSVVLGLIASVIGLLL
ncbi:DUF2905 domain-containing protein [Ideonella sp. B7]|uniref:DUF2905 domain-containing protein n=1 Tax=Ideonella benzenivorans TaxID=2831643 RepID=UPI001CEDCCBA|nr:DUF2905 domain-containing protein [Ideonella benzenivorans]MCA6217252.1 DUF2905 domain-containing protein [Ideonella benzenivorans]